MASVGQPEVGEADCFGDALALEHALQALQGLAHLRGKGREDLNEGRRLGHLYNAHGSGVLVPQLQPHWLGASWISLACVSLASELVVLSQVVAGQHKCIANVHGGWLEAEPLLHQAAECLAVGPAGKLEQTARLWPAALEAKRRSRRARRLEDVETLAFWLYAVEKKTSGRGKLSASVGGGAERHAPPKNMGALLIGSLAALPADRRRAF